MANSSPGWYPDPDNSLQSRYWDGTAWTDAIQINPEGADSWQQSTQLAEPDRSTYIRYAERQSPQNTSSSGVKWLIGVVIFLVLIFGFQSCGNRGWQMGVDGNGYQVTCQDGTISMSGGIQGACSHHGGVK